MTLIRSSISLVFCSDSLEENIGYISSIYLIYLSIYLVARRSYYTTVQLREIIETVDI